MDPRAFVADGIGFDVVGARATITLDRQETRNALGAAGLAALTTALDRAEAATDVRVVVLTHAGPVFSSGADLAAAAGADAADQPVAVFPALLQRLWACPKPVVAAIDGKTRAGGIGLVAVSDHVVATPGSDFATSEVRVGVVPYVISVPFLARVPSGAAREWLLTGSVFDAARAHRDGLVDAVTDDVEGTVGAYVDAISRGGPEAVTATKVLLRGDVTPAMLAQRYAALAESSARRFTSAEGQEGIAATRGRRPAAWIPTSREGES